MSHLQLPGLRWLHQGQGPAACPAVHLSGELMQDHPLLLLARPACQCCWPVMRSSLFQELVSWCQRLHCLQEVRSRAAGAVLQQLLGLSASSAL